jgi:hypothetical protein
MNEIKDFSGNIETFTSRIDKSILGLQSDSIREHGISLDKIFQILNRIEEQYTHNIHWFKSQEFVKLKDLKETERKIMSKIKEFSDRQNVFNDRMDVAVADLQGDIKYLTDTITTLQSTSGSITPEDQALLDQIEVRASTIADKLDALDALTPVSGSV